MDDKKLKEFLDSIDRSKFTNQPYLKKIEKPWGYELMWVPVGLPYCAKILHINRGKRLSLQVHDVKVESGYLSFGQCNLVIEGKDGEMSTISMKQGQGYTILPGQKHRYQAVTDCEIFEASTPEAGNTYRLEDDYLRPTETEEMRKESNRGWK